MNDALLRTSDLTKRYGAITVLDQITFELQAGEIHGLLGANGAGKSTLCKIIAGLIPASNGAMTIRGEAFRPLNKQAAESSGVEIVQQELNLVPTLSVAENLHLTNFPNFGGIIRQSQLHNSARDILNRYGLADVATDALVGELGVGRQQMVEIASALARNCRLLILDEPTAALSAGESERLFGWLSVLRDQGVGIIYVSHRLAEVRELTNRVTVLRDGKFACTRRTNELTTDHMVDLMSGTASSKSKPHDFRSYATSNVALRVDGISCGLVRDVTFRVHRGERFGIAGLVGSGRTETLRAIFGADIAHSGHVFIGSDDAPRRFRAPNQAVAAGLAMVTEDRKQNGLLLSQSIQVNTTISALRQRFSIAGVIRRRLESQCTTAQCESMETRYEHIDQSVETLSGGNQQKVAVAKWLVKDAAVFLFDEPTRGIDVAARRRIYQLFESLAAEGKGLVIVSSDLEELLTTCDRIAVMSAGKMVEEFHRGDWNEEKIMRAAFSKYVV
jgi:ribose transport system ATP-binding protein